MKDPKKDWTVSGGSAAQAFGPRQVRNYEDGFLYNEWPEGFVVIAYNSYGQEYNLPFTFKTEESMDRFLDRVKAHLAAGGDLNLDHWNFSRVQYGTQAYLEEEPYIVARERADALAGLDN